MIAVKKAIFLSSFFQRINFDENQNHNFKKSNLCSKKIY